MRVRDLRWYILASIIIIISYAGIALCFYLSISNGKVEESMKELALRACKNESQLVTEKIDEYTEMFTRDGNDSLIYYNAGLVDGQRVYKVTNPENPSELIDTRNVDDIKDKIFEKCPNQTGLANKFKDGVKVIYGQALSFENEYGNQEYYFYFY